MRTRGRCGAGTTRVRVRRSLASSVLLLQVLSGCSSPEPEVVSVVMGTVISGVSANGTLQFVDEVTVGFPEGGVLSEVFVKPGDRVAPGQPLAEVENLEQRMALRKAGDNVRIEQLRLDQAIANNKAATAVQETRDNKDALETARDGLAATNERNEETIEQLEDRVDFDRAEVERFEKRLENDKACLDEPNPDPLMTGPTQECIDRVRAAKDNLKAAQAALLQNEADLEVAEETFDVEASEKELTVDEKVKDRNLAANSAEFEQTERPFNIETQRLMLDIALADLEVARKALQDTVKPTAYSGVVHSINAEVGQVLAASDTGPQGDDQPEGPLGSELIVLTDVHAYQVVVPFSEANGSRISTDSHVDVTFAEHPDLVGQARIASIEPPAPDAASKTYLVTVVLDANDPLLADGLSARVAVALERVENTLTVPTSAVQVNGRMGLVTVQDPDGTHRKMPVELGLVGDRTIEILSGIEENQQVVVREDA